MPLPIVLVPGLLCTGDLFHPQIDALSASTSVVVADNARHGSMAEIAGALLGVAPERFVLGGLSMGGYIALEVMRQAPERVGGLVLLDTSARPDTPEQTARRHELVALGERQSISAVVDELLPSLVDKAGLGDAVLVATVRRMAEDTRMDAFRRQQTAIMNRGDSRATLPRIACPTLVIVGDADRLTPPELAREMAEAIPNAALEIVPECGHLATLERPAAVNESIQRFTGAI